MSFSGYGLLLFYPRKEPVDLNEITEFFDIAYFRQAFMNQWKHGMIREPKFPDIDYFVWSISDLDSGDPDNLFSGLFTYKDMGITLNRVPHTTMLTFIKWVRSIIPSEYPLYFVNISEFGVIKVTNNFDEQAVMKFF